MNNYCLVKTAGLVLLVLPALLLGQDGEACARLFGGHYSPSKRAGPSLSKAELSAIADGRACIRSYGLPGGAEKLPDLTSEDIFKSKQRMQALFDAYCQSEKAGVKDPKVLIRQLEKSIPGLGMDDFSRLLHMDKWDRTQVTLFGEYLYARKLREEGHYGKCVSAATTVAREFKLQLKAATPTEADEHTYFSTAALSNLILLEQLAARARLVDATQVQASDLKLLVDLLDNREALEWQFQYVGGDPSAEFAERLSGLYARVANAPDSVDLTPLGKLDLTAGYFHDREGTVVLLKGKRTYGLSENPDGVELLAPREAATRFRSFSRKEVAEKSTAEMRLFGVHSYDGKFEVDLSSGTYTVTAAEYKALALGKPLPETHPLHQEILHTTDDQALVLYTHPLAVKPGSLQSKSDSFVFALQKAYPWQPIYRDPYSARTSILAKQLKNFRLTDRKDMVVVLAEDSFAVQDFKIVQNVKGDLLKAAATLVTFTKSSQPAWAYGKGKAVIVITGHIDANLAKFVNALGAAGYFDGNYVVFNSCRSPLSRDLVNQVTTRFKAAATFSFDSKIQTSGVEDFLVELTGAIREDAPASFEANVRRAAKKAKLNGVWTICENLPVWRRPGATPMETAVGGAA